MILRGVEKIVDLEPKQNYSLCLVNWLLLKEGDISLKLL